MTWRTRPKAPRVDVAGIVRSVFAKAGEDIRDELVAASPVRTGRLRDSWVVGLGADIARVEPAVPYAEYVEIDKSGAEAVVARVESEILTQIETHLSRGA